MKFNLLYVIPFESSSIFSRDKYARDYRKCRKHSEDQAASVKLISQLVINTGKYLHSHVIEKLAF